MKQFKLTGLCEVSLIALALLMASCSKSSSNSSPKLGTISFAVNGKGQSVTATADTSQGEIIITGLGVAPGTKDSISLGLILWETNGNPINQYTGFFADTAANNQIFITYSDYTAQNEYSDAGATGPSNFNGTITSNTGGVLVGTFKGTVWLNGGPGADSIVVTNGPFNIQL